MQPWHKVVTPREEVRAGRSFNPDEFAIHLENVVAGTAPVDYRDPIQFFSRTCFTRALRAHAGMVLRRLKGESANTAPVLTLITQFGGGKTHTLTTLFHMAKSGDALSRSKETSDLVSQAELPVVDDVRTAVFVGNAWDPEPGRETPWIDVARQLAGDAGAEALGPEAKAKAPGTLNLQKVFKAANGPVLILMDEVLNFFNRHRDMADGAYAFFDNLVRAVTAMTQGAAVISLPRSQIEMTDWDQEWQEKITKVARRVAKDLIVNDEAETADVIRKRLFDDVGTERVRKSVAAAYADWCFEHRAQLPPEWTAVDTAATEQKARDRLVDRFLSCYPFHPATISVFQRKWQALAQYQQTRGTLAMFAQWVSWAYENDYKWARNDPLLTLGSAPLDLSGFRSMVLGQLGEARLQAAIETDIAGDHSHAKALDADQKGALQEIHRRVGAAILFESSGGQRDKLAHLPELRFALGGPSLPDTTSVDSAAHTLESKAFFISRVGTDGFKVYHKATIRKAVSDRRASLDPEREVTPCMRKLVEKEFGRGTTLPIAPFPKDAAAVPNASRLTLVVMDPETPWSETKRQREQTLDWTRNRGGSSRLSPAAILWCFKKGGRDFRDKVEQWLAWQRVQREVDEGILGADYDKADRNEITAQVKTAEENAQEEVLASYRFVVLADAKAKSGLKEIDLGAGHSSGGQTLCGRIIAALKSHGLLSEGVGASYLERNWPPAFKEAGAWPLQSLRQAFLDGSMTRLVDPDRILPAKIGEAVAKGELGLASGKQPDGAYGRVWFGEPVSLDDITFESDVYVLRRKQAKRLASGAPEPPPEPPAPEPEPEPEPETGKGKPKKTTVRISGAIPSEVWNRMSRTVIAKLRNAGDVRVRVEMEVEVDAKRAAHLKRDLKQALEDLGLGGQLRLE